MAKIIIIAKYFVEDRCFDFFYIYHAVKIPTMGPVYSLVQIKEIQGKVFFCYEAINLRIYLA